MTSKYTRMFIDETRLCLQTLGTHLDHLRTVPGEPESLAECHRMAHSIKGMASFEDQDAIVTLSRALEEAFSRLRGDAPPNGVIPHLERGITLLEVMIGEVERAGTATTDSSTLVQSIQTCLGN